MKGGREGTTSFHLLFIEQFAYSNTICPAIKDGKPIRKALR